MGKCNVWRRRRTPGHFLPTDLPTLTFAHVVTDLPTLTFAHAVIVKMGLLGRDIANCYIEEEQRTNLLNPSASNMSIYCENSKMIYSGVAPAVPGLRRSLIFRRTLLVIVYSLALACLRRSDSNGGTSPLYTR